MSPRGGEISGEQMQGREKLIGVRPAAHFRGGLGEGEGIIHLAIRGGGPGCAKRVLALRFDGKTERQIGPATSARGSGVVDGPADGAGQRHSGHASSK